MVIVLLFSGGGLVRSAELEELERLREIYFQQVGEITLPVKKKYGRSLVELQKQLISENALEEALEVKKEIEELKASLTSGTPVSAPAVTSVTEPNSLMATKDEQEEEVDSGSGVRFRWTGDVRKDKYQGDIVYRLDAKRNAEVVMTTLLEDLQDEFPKGFTWRFLYRSEDYKGIGFRIGCDFPRLRILRSVTSAVRPNGNWIERTQPFDDTKGEEEAKFFINLFEGEGSVMIKDIELIPLP